MKTPMKCSANGRRFIKSFERCRLKAYRDSGGVWTIGWGHTDSKVHEGLLWLQIEANYVFDVDIGQVENGVNRLVAPNVELTQSQFDALCSFAYNVGLDEDEDTKAEGLGDSTLLKLLNAGNIREAAAEFLKWNHSGGEVVKGLTRRRKAESAMFMQGVIKS